MGTQLTRLYHERTSSEARNSQGNINITSNYDSVAVRDVKYAYIGCIVNENQPSKLKYEPEREKYCKNTSHKASSPPPWYAKYIGNDDVNRIDPVIDSVIDPVIDPVNRTFSEEEVFAQWHERNGQNGSTLSEGLRDAFRVIKFTSNCLEDKSSYMKLYFTKYRATGTWSKFKCALPNKLLIKLKDLSGRVENEPVGDVTISSDKPSLTMLEVVEEFGKVNIGNSKALGLLSKGAQAPVSLDVKMSAELGALQFPFLLKKVLESGVVLTILEYAQKSLSEDDMSNDQQVCQITAYWLKKLFCADSCCPVQLSLAHIPVRLQLAVIEAMQEVPEACRLKSFAFFQVWDSDTTQLWKVLAEKWLSNLHHLGMGSKKWGSGDKLNPILKRLTKPGCSLTSLHLRNYGNRNGHGPLLEDLVVLASQLETLKLQEMNLRFDVTRISKYAVNEKCSLKSLRLKRVELYLDGSLPSVDENQKLLLAWKNVALNLEELTIDDCTFPIELFSWLNLSLPKLRTLSIGAIYNRATPNIQRQFYANQVLEALTRSNGKTIKELSLLNDFWESDKVLKLDPIRKALQCCPMMMRVHLGISGESETSSSDTEALEIHLVLFRIVLSVPELQNVSSIPLFNFCETFRAIAEKAEKWPGNDKECSSLLTLGGLSNKVVYDAMHVFETLEQNCCFSYVKDGVYKLSFPG